MENLTIKMGTATPRPGHVPQRSCCACRIKKARPELLRLVRLPTGDLAIDLPQNLPGRGAYVCPTLACVTALAQTKGLNRSFRQVVPELFYDSLVRFFSKYNNNG